MLVDDKNKLFVGASSYMVYMTLFALIRCYIEQPYDYGFAFEHIPRDQAIFTDIHLNYIYTLITSN